MIRNLFFSLLLFCASANCFAFSWQDLWHSKDQQAAKLLENGQAKMASEKFKDPSWKAASKYRAQEFDAANDLYSQFNDPISHYNRGNTLAKRGQLPEAIGAYDKAIEMQDNFDDAKFNRDLIKKMLEQQQNQQGQGDNQQQNHSQNSNQNQQQNQSQNSNQNQQQNQSQNSNQNQQQNQSQNSNQNQQQNQSQNSNQNQQQNQSQNSNQNQQQNQSQNSNQNQQDNQSPNSDQNPEQNNSLNSSQNQQNHFQKSNQNQPQNQSENSNQKQQSNQTKGKNQDQEKQNANQQTTGTPKLSREEQEKHQAMQQLLQKIPDNPGGLLKRKFQRDYQKRLRRDI